MRRGQGKSEAGPSYTPPPAGGLYYRNSRARDGHQGERKFFLVEPSLRCDRHADRRVFRGRISTALDSPRSFTIDLEGFQYDRMSNRLDAKRWKV